MRRAFGELARLAGTRVTGRSALYRTEPVGYAEQPRFVNACARVETRLAPREPLEALLAIEKAHGRERGVRAGPRPLDLDLRLYGGALTETPGLARAKKATYLEEYNRPGTEGGWHFLTGQQDAITKLTDAVGFRYAYDPASGQYAHATAIMVLTPQGKLARYFYGIQYPPGGLRLSLVEASQEKIGSPVDAILLFCCAYDPATGKYGLLVSRLLMIAGGLTIVTVGTLVFMLSRTGKHAHA